MRPLRLRRNMINFARWGWQSGLTGTTYDDLSPFYHRRRHALAFGVGKALGKRWNF